MNKGDRLRNEITNAVAQIIEAKARKRAEWFEGKGGDWPAGALALRSLASDIEVHITRRIRCGDEPDWDGFQGAKP